MAAQGRNKTKYPGVYYTEGKSTTGKSIRRYYVVFKREGKVYEEAAKVLVDGGPDTRPAESPQEASAWRSRRIGEVTQQQGKGKPALTVDEIWSKWVEGMKGRGGLHAARSRYKMHVGRFFGKRVASELCTFDVTRFRRDLERNGLAPASVKFCMALLSQLLRWAADQDLIQDPGLKFDYPKFDNQKTESLTPEQIGRYWEVLDAWPDQHIADFFRVMLLTGVRKTALANVRWDDINFENGFLTLRAETSKSGKVKSIPLSAQALSVFKSIPRTEDSDLVWPGWNGPRTNFSGHGRAIAKAAGLPDSFRGCHGLRHAFASALASSGRVDLFTLQTLLTHSSPNMTQRYSHLSSDALRRAASVADEVLTPGQGSKVVAIGEE